MKGKGWSIFDGDDDFYLLNKNNSYIISNSSSVLGVTSWSGDTETQPRAHYFACK